LAVRAASGTNSYFSFIDLPVEMRVTPTVSSTVLNIHKPNVRLEALASSSVNGNNPGSVSLTVVPNTNDTNATAGFPYGGSLIADAEL
jgi:hypothetical protein